MLPSRSKRQFTVRALLFCVFCICGLLAGYRVGFDRGYNAGHERRARETVVARVYPVNDLLSYGRAPGNASQDWPDFDTMLQLITCTIAPESWDDVGGPGSIVPELETLSVVVRQTPSIHEDLERLFSDLRSAKQRLQRQAPSEAR